MQDIVLDIENEIKNLIGIKENNKFNNKKTLILSGGGTRGLVYYGVLKALDELKILENITTFATTSVGALISIMYLIGYNVNEMEQFMYLFDIKKLSSFESIEKISFLEILQNYGFDDGENIHIIINKLLKGKGLKENLTLLELYQHNKKKFIATTVCINTKTTEYLSYETYPNLRVSDAIRMSTCVPIYYTPVIMNNKFYVDGGCMDNYPIYLFKDTIDEVIGVYVDNMYETSNINNMQSYLLNTYQTYNKGYVNNVLKNWEKYTILINIKQDNILEFDVSKKKKKMFFKLGYDSVYNFFNKINQPHHHLHQKNK
jgi:predicted acylesterase/phospholipase RssA